MSRIRTFWNSFNRIELGTNTSIAKKIGIDHRPPTLFHLHLASTEKMKCNLLNTEKTIVLLSQHNNIILMRVTKN